MKSENIAHFLDQEVKKRHLWEELSWDKPDPLWIARENPCEYKALIRALFGYGNAKAIVSFLQKFPFALLDSSWEDIETSFPSMVYRFQKRDDMIALTKALSSLKKQGSLEEIFLRRYPDEGVIGGIGSVIDAIKAVYPYHSVGYEFLVGSIEGNGALKRWNMFLRWMVRDDGFDLGLWKRVRQEDLMIPLDTHTFNVGKKLGLIKRRTYDRKAAIELTLALKAFDPLDPVKYDFALYRLGQERIV